MPENTSDHRFARAAGRAARAFRENRAAEREQAARTEAERPAPSPAPPIAERVTRASSEAARAFREGQARDDERLREVRTRVRQDDEARRAQARADREAALDRRDEAEAGIVHPLLKLVRLWWLGVAVLLLGIGGAFLWNGSRAAERGGRVIDPLTGMESIGPLGGATGQFIMGGVAVVMALTALWGWVGLLRRRRAAVGTLTFLAVLLVVPAALRPNVLFIVAGLLMGVGAVLVWLPPVRSRLRR